VVLSGNPLQSNWGSASSDIPRVKTDIRYFGQQWVTSDCRIRQSAFRVMWDESEEP
jgi:hypothetical protein